MQSSTIAVPASLVDELRAAMPTGALVLDESSRILHSQDIFTRGVPAAMVVQPGSLAELEQAVGLLCAADVPCVARGGGMSYTGGLLPQAEQWAVVDLGRMNRVVEINQDDMFVTVECGCTWKTLHEALAEVNLRTPYWGTLSGIRATVGGGLSQNAIFWGSGQYGTAIDSLLSLTVVLADGTRVETGSASHTEGSPFFRHFGPDLTGLFCADTGALGIKAHATLRLMPTMPARDYLACDFADAHGALSAMSDISRAQLASECFGFDPALQRQRMKRQGLGADAKALVGVVKTAKSLWGAVKDSVGIALAGRRYMDDVDFSVQVVVEDRNEPAARARADAVRAICKRRGGREIENSIPKITRANPFGPVNSMLGPEGERWLPIHGLFPHSKILAAYDAVEAVLARHREQSEAHGVVTGYLFATVSTHCSVLEPVIFWPDEWLEIHEDAVEPAHLSRLQRHTANPDALAHVQAMRSDLVELFAAMGAAHLQIGRTYRYRQSLKPGPARLVEAVKAAIDPSRTMNPGSLGLE